MTSLREFLENASTRIERQFNESGAVSPMFHFIDGGGRDIVMLAPPGDKNQSSHLARLILAQSSATRCLMMDECWMLDFKDGPSSEAKEAEAMMRRGESIQNHPKRIEAVMFMAEDASEGMIGAFREIVRKMNSRARLGPLVYLPTGGQAEGRYVGLLPRGKLSS